MLRTKHWVDTWKQRKAILLISILVFLSVCLVWYLRKFGVISSVETLPGDKQTIVFTAAMATGFRSGEWGMFTADPDTGKLGRWSVGEGIEPAGVISWSPKRQEMLLGGYVDRRSEIFVADRDGSLSQTALLHDRANPTWGHVWSPDGKQVAFFHNHQIYLQNIDGTDLRQLTSVETFAIHPSWSPDGGELAFTSFKEPTEDYVIYRIDRDGVNLTSLSDHLPGSNSDPKWSPDGGLIAFKHAESGEPYTLWLMDTDGSNIKEILEPDSSGNVHRGVGDFAWSPDGQRIAFASGRDGNCDRFMREEEVCSESLYLIDVDGTNLTRLTYRWQYQTHLAWIP